MLTVLLVTSLIVCGWQTYRIPGIEREYAGLLAEHNSRTSWGSVGVSLAKSFVDGVTLGATGDEGVFSESKKWDRVFADFEKRKTELSHSAATARRVRNWSLLLSIGILVFLLALPTEATNPAGREPS